ncbi:hypothetical protein EA772_20645 [Pedobacter sp. G11]|nr:hypothetical protein EA772_20645 [Pedobacter sp. G11]
MNYFDNKTNLKFFYEQNGLSGAFDTDNIYLENAFNEIYKIWLDNFKQIKTVNYLMIAEAPLWGNIKKYIYNPKTNNSQFFYRSDLGDILNRQIDDKEDFIKICNEIGLLIVDISPFPLNSKDTKINYSKNVNGSKKLSYKQYQQLVRLTIPTFFELKIRAITDKKSEHIKTFFRYARVKNNFEDIISRVLVDYKIIKTQNDIGDISQNGGGIDKTKFKEIIDKSPNR